MLEAGAGPRSSRALLLRLAQDAHRGAAVRYTVGKLVDARGLVRARAAALVASAVDAVVYLASREAP